MPICSKKGNGGPRQEQPFWHEFWNGVSWSTPADGLVAAKTHKATFNAHLPVPNFRHSFILELGTVEQLSDDEKWELCRRS